MAGNAEKRGEACSVGPIVRVVFFGTPEPAARVLDAVLQAGHRVVGVVTQPDKPAGRHHVLTAPPVKLRAAAAGVPVIQPSTLRMPEPLQQLLAWRPEVAVVVAYGKIIPKAMLEAGVPFINIHFSLLPAYRGAAPVQRALMDGLRETGVTIQYLAEELDAGDIIVQKPVRIEEDDTTETLMGRCVEVGTELLLEVLPNVAVGHAPRVPQNHAAATLAPKLRKEDGILDWRQSARALHNRVRACNPWPGACAFIQGEPLKIWRTRVVDEASPAGPGGTILSARGRLLVAGEPGTLELLEVQPAGRARMSASAYLAGHSLGGRFDIVNGSSK